jgi:TonB family protein
MSAESLLQILGLSTIASSAAVLLALAWRKPMRRQFGAQAAYASWCVVPLSAAVALLPAPIATAPLPAVGAAVSQVLLPLASPAAASAWQFDAMPWLASLWLLGMAASMLRLMRQQQRFLRALGPLAAGEGQLLRARTTVGCPALVGAWQPRIIVPADFDVRFTPVERALIIEHEQLHRARGDAQINLFVAALRCLFWFNPLVHFAASRFRFDQELACDAIVISRFPEARRPYADAMLKTQLAGDSGQEPGLPVGCYWQSSHPLKERITMLKHPLPGRARSAFGFGIAAALSACCTYAAWAAQPATPPAALQADAAGSAQPQDKPTAAANPLESKATYRSMRRIAYPPAQIAAKVQGVVYVKVHVAADGNLTSVVAERVDPPSAAELAEAAVAGVKTWRFNPAAKANAPVASDEVIPIVFSLRPDAVPKVSPGTLDAIRVSPPDEPGVASADRPPTEDVTFRDMHPPHYPSEAVQQKQSGDLVFKVLVDEHGAPQAVDVEKSNPPEAARIFTQASIEAIMQWRFNPGLKDGKPFAGYVLVPITFALHDD